MADATAEDFHEKVKKQRKGLLQGDLGINVTNVTLQRVMLNVRT